MAITPQTDIRLMNVPLELDNKNQLTFSNAEAQFNYFNSLSFLQADNCSYQRKDNIIRFPAHIDTILKYNYVMYQNENYTNKWFYAFITNMKYVNDNMTEITIKTDVFQTWQFDIIYKNMFIEREHVLDDTIGNHTIEENLDVGEIREVAEIEDISLSQYYYIAINSSWNPATEKQFSGVTEYNKNIFANQIFLISGNTEDTLLNLQLFLLKTNSDAHIADVSNIFIVPSALIKDNLLVQQTGTVGGETFTFYKLNQSIEQVSIPQVFNKITSFQGYTPKNNKCFIYPYNYILASNNNGSYNIFKYEDFSTSNVQFRIDMAMGIGVSGRLVPLNYKSETTCDDESIPLAKYPVCGWSADSYTNWLTQNAINTPLKILNMVINTASSVTSEKPQGVANIVPNIASIIGEFREASLLPNIGASENTGDVSFASNRHTFTIRCMQCKIEYIKIIDDFFSMYGYKINRVKLPNVTGRQNWNYVKTLNCNITGNIPQDDVQELKSIFDNGVTFWHNPSTFLDYTQSNN